MVSVPYEITLLSNLVMAVINLISVSVPYEITLLSNPKMFYVTFLKVSVPYEITLLSNNIAKAAEQEKFQYLMKLHYSQTGVEVICLTDSFSTL